MDQLKANLQDIKLKPNPQGGQESSVGQRPPASGAQNLGGFVVAASDLESQRHQLRPTEQPHPNQLQDLSEVSEGTISGLADVLRRAVNERRLALNEVNSVDQSMSYVDSGWSVG